MAAEKWNLARAPKELNIALLLADDARFTMLTFEPVADKRRVSGARLLQTFAGWWTLRQWVRTVTLIRFAEPGTSGFER
jgi:hypothetical protein